MCGAGRSLGCGCTRGRPRPGRHDDRQRRVTVRHRYQVPPLVWDSLLPALLLLNVVTTYPARELPVVAALTAALAPPLVWRRRAPLAAFAAVLACGLRPVAGGRPTARGHRPAGGPVHGGRAHGPARHAARMRRLLRLARTVDDTLRRTEPSYGVAPLSACPRRCRSADAAALERTTGPVSGRLYGTALPL